MSKIYLFVSVDILPGKKDQYLQELKSHLEKIRLEDGCESIEVFEEEGNSSQVHLWEVWSNRSAWDAHMTNENSKAWQATAVGLVSGEKITVLTRP